MPGNSFWIVSWNPLSRSRPDPEPGAMPTTATLPLPPVTRPISRAASTPPW